MNVHCSLAARSVGIDLADAIFFFRTDFFAVVCVTITQQTEILLRFIFEII